MKHNKRHFTLLELLIVAAILVAIAGIGISNLSGVTDRANDGLVLAEMQTIAKAIRQFKQDTGYYPKTGPFNLEDKSGGRVEYDNLPDEAGSSNTVKERWFNSPANFYQLLSTESPLAGTNHQLKKWNPETGRGWRGPYLTCFNDGYVDIRSELNDANNNPSSSNYYEKLSPLDGTNIADVPGIADPFEFGTVKVGSNTLLDWSTTPGGTERNEWGRPYLVFDLDSKPFIISMGPNGRHVADEYSSDDADEIRLNIEGGMIDND